MVKIKDICGHAWSFATQREVSGKILRRDALPAADFFVDAQNALLDPPADRFDAHFEQPGDFGNRVEVLRLGIGHGVA